MNSVLPFMNYMLKKDGERVLLNKGLFAEFLSRLYKYAESDGGDKVVSGNGTTFNEEFLKIVMDDMTDDYGVEVLFHATVCDVLSAGGKIKEIKVVGSFGIGTLQARYFVDATGDAVLSLLAGASYHVGREKDGKCQPMTLCFRMGNVDMEKFRKEDLAKVNKLWKEKLAAGQLINPREDILIFSHTTDSVLHLNSTRLLKSPVSAKEKSVAEKEARKQMLELYRFLVKNAPSCKNATLLSSSVEIGVRESRMIDGLYVLTKDDIVACRKFPDAVAAGNYDIDIHSPDGSGTSHYWVPEGEYYTIPYRSLIPKGFDNLMVVGRCISSTHEAQASYRIMPIVACIGEGGGTVLAADKALPMVTNAEVRAAVDAYDLVEGYPEACEK